MFGLPRRTKLLNAVETRLDGVAASVAGRAPVRPWWQRLLLPLAGALLLIAGLIFLFTPIPLSVLALIGIPLMFCFHRPYEDRARRCIVARIGTVRRLLKRLHTTNGVQDGKGR